VSEPAADLKGSEDSLQNPSVEPEDRPRDPAPRASRSASKGPALLQRLEQISKLATALGGFGLLILYALGASGYAMRFLIFGVAPFEFTISACLEAGVQFVTDLAYSLPLFLLAGVWKAEFHSTGGLWLALPLLAMAILVFANRRRARLIQRVASIFLLAYVAITLLVGFAANFAICTYQDLLLNPAIKTALEIGPSADFKTLGLTDPIGLLWAAMFGEPDQFVHQIAVLVTLNLYVLLVIWAALRFARSATARGDGRLLRIARRSGRVLRVAAWIYTGFVVFWINAYLGLATAARMPKVDAAIAGLENLTSRTYLILYAEDKDRYSFYVPTEQRVILVPREKVANIIIKGSVSMFVNRAVFKKGPYLGIAYRFHAEPKGATAPPTGSLEITGVDVGGPAFKAGLLVGDRILDVDGKGTLALLTNLPGILEGAAKDTPVKLTYIRGGKRVDGEIWIEDRP
jgi:hypothetical protein